jgi:hypothetical protein
MRLGSFFELCRTCPSILTSPEFVGPLPLSDSKAARRR